MPLMWKEAESTLDEIGIYRLSCRKKKFSFRIYEEDKNDLFSIYS